MSDRLGTIATKRLLRKAATELGVDIAALESTTATHTTEIADFTCFPIRAFAFIDGFGTHTIIIRFSIAVASPVGLDATKWSSTLGTIDQVNAVSGVVGITFTGTPFVPANEASPSITLTYAGTDAAFVDAIGSGRAVPAFSAFPADPRFDLPEADFMLMIEQAGDPTGDPTAGYRRLFPKADGWYDEDSAGVVTALGGSPGGSDTQLQYNNAGAFAGADLNYSLLGAPAVELQPADRTGTVGVGLRLRAGDSTDDAGGTALLSGGDGISHDPSYAQVGPGSMYFIGGAAKAGTNFDGSDLNFQAGAKDGSGVNGRLFFLDPSSGFYSIFDTSALTAARTHTLPDATGTLTTDEGSLTNVYNAFVAFLADLIAGVTPFNPGVLLEEQASAPSTPASGQGMVYGDNTGKLHYLNDGAVNLTLHPENDQFILAAEVFR